MHLLCLCYANFEREHADRQDSLSAVLCCTTVRFRYIEVAVIKLALFVLDAERSSAIVTMKRMSLAEAAVIDQAPYWQIS